MRRGWSRLVPATGAAGLLGGLLATNLAIAAGLQGMPMEAAIRQLEARGLSVVYSSDLVRPEFTVLAEPTGTEPRDILREILRPYRLDVATGPAGRLLVVRVPAGGRAASSGTVGTAAGLTEIVVTASRYQLELGRLESARAITAQDLELLPELADDPIRSIARLPGVARQDFSSKPIIRGGVPDETLVRFDGVRLYDPYHLKDFLSLTSAIDPNVVEGMTVYTAAFPVSYGDRLSGVVDIMPVRPGPELGGRIAASVFNLSALVGGPFDAGQGDWIAAIRRGNLDLVLDVANSDLGRPGFGDAYARIGHHVADGLHVAANVLVSSDDLSLFDSDQEEQATAEYHDEYLWLNLDAGSADAAGARVQVARGRLSSERRGTADLPGVGSGRLDDQRQFTIWTLAADGWWSLSDRSRVEAGLEWRSAAGRYDYSDRASFDLLFLTPGAPQEPTRTRAARVRATGDHFAAYATWRLNLTDAMVADLGLRWDRETLSADSSDRLGPRVGALWELETGTRIRVGWGRFFQAQNINELQVSDGDTQFHPGQRADHWVLSVEQPLLRGLDVRIEAFHKEYDDLKPRYENLLYPLVVLPELKPDRVMIALDSARADGLEVSASYANGALAAWTSYSWGRVRDRLGGRSVARSWDQEHSLDAGASYRGDHWDFSLTGTWRSGWPTTSVELAALEPFPLVRTGPRNARRLGNYLRFDMRVARRFEFAGDNDLSVYLEVSNVTNRRNDCCVEYQLEDGDAAPYLDVADVASLPLVPSIGFVWSF